MIFSRIQELSDRQPEHVAIIDGETRISYAELLRQVDVWAERLRAHGRPGDVVAVSLPNVWQYPTCFLAIARLNAICLPCNPQWRSAEVSWFVQNLGIRTVITCEELRVAWDALSPDVTVISIDEVTGNVPKPHQSNGPAPIGSFAFPLFPVAAPDTPALYLATSGSTGRPKLVPRTHANLLGGSAAVAEVLPVGPGTRFLSIVPFHHANGFANGLFMPLTTGGTLVMLRSALPTLFFDTIERHGIQIVNMAPVLYNLIAEHGIDRAALASVTTFLTSGAPLDDSVRQVWQSTLDRPVRHLYGSSETGTIAIETADILASDNSRIPGSVGRPLPAVRVRILTSTDDAAPADATQLETTQLETTPLETAPPVTLGEIAVQGPALMTGYVHEPELNQHAFRDGFFRTGDCGYLTATGELVLQGRSKRWLNLGGVKVDPVEVEQVLATLPAVRQCRVVAEPGPKGIDVIVARIGLHSGTELPRADVIAHCRRSLADYKIPRVITFVETLPVDLTGKDSLRWGTP